MSKQVVNKKYLREFFKLGKDAEAESELARIEEKLVRLQFENGRDICVIDEEPDGMYFLESGSVAVLDRDGKQINLMHNGQYFGEYAVLAQQRRLSTVRSIGRTVVYRLDGGELMRILQRHPNVYGELMKRVYNQVSRKHAQINLLSGIRRGILQVPGNETPLSPKQMLFQYGAAALVFLLAAILAPRQSVVPVFAIPLVFMVAYVLYSRRTLGALIASGLLAAMLAHRSGLFVNYTDSLLEALSTPGIAATVMITALMGSVVTLIEASGALTAFKKRMDRRIRSKTHARFAAVGILALTAIDDCLNMLCASTSLRTASSEQRVPREEMALLFSLLPTVLCSFLPFSLWGIYVISNLNAVSGGRGAALFVRSIRFNFFSLITLAAMLAFCFGHLPRSRVLKDAAARVESGGTLWPAGSERYLSEDDEEVWGQLQNLLLPVLVLGASLLTLHRFYSGDIVMNSARSLVITLAFMFFLYCTQGLMSPETFLGRLVSGIESMVLPCLLYLLTMSFSTLLEQEAMGEFFDSLVVFMRPMASVVPAALFFLFALLTMALGSSWAMYVIGFPIALHIARTAGLDMPLCIGAVCAAGIAGEKLCVFTGDALSVGTAIGCAPDAVLSVRLPYSVAFFSASFLLYLAAGFISAA